VIFSVHTGQRPRCEYQSSEAHYGPGTIPAYGPLHVARSNRPRLGRLVREPIGIESNNPATIAKNAHLRRFRLAA